MEERDLQEFVSKRINLSKIFSEGKDLQTSFLEEKCPQVVFEKEKSLWVFLEERGHEIFFEEERCLQTAFLVGKYLLTVVVEKHQGFFVEGKGLLFFFLEETNLVDLFVAEILS